MHKFFSIMSAVLLYLVLSCCTVLASAYTLTTIVDSSVYPGNVACGINDAGQIIGDNVQGAFIWDIDNGTRMISGMSQARSINNYGLVAGNYGGRARIWTEANGFTDLPAYEGFTNMNICGVNDNGDVVGGLFNSSEYFSHAFAWSNTGGSRLINNVDGDQSGALSINNDNLIVGWTVADSLIRGAIWDASGNRTLLNAEYDGSCYVLDVNNRGQAVGWAERVDRRTNAHYATAFIWDAVNGMRYLGTLSGGFVSCAYGINDLGQVVGFSTVDGNFGSMAFVWDEASGMRSLGDLHAEGYSEARAINNLGQIVGFYASTDFFDREAVLWQPVPEPGSLFALAGGLIGLVGFVIRKRGT